MKEGILIKYKMNNSQKKEQADEEKIILYKKGIKSHFTNPNSP